MAETEAIARMAELIADEIFGVFMWNRVGPINQNWPCVKTEEHGVATHPTDVVFEYREPYSATNTYLQCDLKSYARDTIKPAEVRKALKSLSMQVSCANISEIWQKYYSQETANYQIHGLLFIYNHDGEYDRNFYEKVIRQIDLDAFSLPRRSRMYILAPDDIFWLHNVALDILYMRGKKAIPGEEHCSFFYPQLIRYLSLTPDSSQPATIEMLTGPVIILQSRDPTSSRRKFLIYVRGKKISDDFMVLLDFLRSKQVIDGNTDIYVRSFHAENGPEFEKAQSRYIFDFLETDVDTEIVELIKAIKHTALTSVKTTFSQVEIGMQRNA